jgi:hypothetical protein
VKELQLLFYNYANTFAANHNGVGLCLPFFVDIRFAFLVAIGVIVIKFFLYKSIYKKKN